VTLTRRGLLGTLIAGTTLPHWLQFRRKTVQPAVADIGIGIGYYHHYITFVNAKGEAIASPTPAEAIAAFDRGRARKLYIDGHFVSDIPEDAAAAVHHNP
jgi:hypothetical protein